MELLFTEDTSARGAVVRVQRHLKAKAVGDDNVRFDLLIWASWRERAARCLKTRGAMVTNAAKGKQRLLTITTFCCKLCALLYH